MWMTGPLPLFFFGAEGSGIIHADEMAKEKEQKTYTLKRMALRRNEAMVFAKMMFARGELRRRASGMMGLSTRLSTYRQVGKHTAKIDSEVMMSG